MPEQTGAPADAQTGDATSGAAAGAASTGESGAAGAAGAAGNAPRTFTQEELNDIVAARLAREKPDPEIARKAAEFDKLQDGQKTELEKAQEKAVKAEQKAAEAEARANATLIRAGIISEAAAQGAVDPDTVAALLASDASITVQDDGSVAGAKEAVKTLLGKKSFLKGNTTGGGPSGGEFGGQNQATIAEKIAELERAGKYAEARDLKIQQMGSV